MKLFRFVHSADLHLDSPFKGLSKLPEQIQSIARDSTLAAFEQLINICIERKADFLLVAGDVYDEQDRSIRAQVRFQQGMEKLAREGIKVFVIHGNHDPVDGYKAMLRWPENTYFYPSDQVNSIPFLKDGKEVAQIIGRSFPTRSVMENYAITYKKSEQPSFAIGLLHTNVDGTEGFDNYAPCTTRDLIHSGIHYWALGHIHTKSLNKYDHCTIAYPGNIQGRNVRETGPRGCYVVDVNDSFETKVEFVVTDRVRWEQKTLSIASMDREQDLIDSLEHVKEEVRMEANGRPVFLRVLIEGRGPLHRIVIDERKMEMIEAMLTDGEEQRIDFVWIESIQVRTGNTINRSKLLQEENILSDLLRYSSSVIDDQEQLERLLEEAVHPLLQHGKVSRYVEEMKEAELLNWVKDAEELAIQYLAGSRGEEDED